MSLRRPLALALCVLLSLSACSGDGSPSDPEDPEQELPAQAPPETPEPATPSPSQPPDAASPTQPSDAERARSPLTGEAVDAAALERPVLLAKIENSPQARPQSGLDAADVVYEELVEGGVTRFLAVFHSQLPEIAGPIRSARPIDTQLMDAYEGAGFAYSGARAEVREMLADVSAVLVTEGGPGFFRLPERAAPHNLYLRPAETLQGVVEAGAEPFHGPGWHFDEEVPVEPLSCPTSAGEGCTDPGVEIEIPMSGTYRTGWRYDDEAGVYRRLQNGEPFQVTGSGRIGASNVVVLATRHYVGETGYPETDVLTDAAPAVVLRDGRRYPARWSKPTADARIELTTEDGEPFPLREGATWLHLPPASVVTTSIG